MLPTLLNVLKQVLFAREWIKQQAMDSVPWTLWQWLVRLWQPREGWQCAHQLHLHKSWFTKWHSQRCFWIFDLPKRHVLQQFGCSSSSTDNKWLTNGSFMQAKSSLHCNSNEPWNEVHSFHKMRAHADGTITFWLNLHTVKHVFICQIKPHCNWSDVQFGFAPFLCIFCSCSLHLCFPILKRQSFLEASLVAFHQTYFWSRLLEFLIVLDQTWDFTSSCRNLCFFVGLATVTCDMIHWKAMHCLHEEGGVPYCPFPELTQNTHSYYPTTVWYSLFSTQSNPPIKILEISSTRFPFLSLLRRRYHSNTSFFEGTS